jgi:hypothetical protein
MFFRVPQAPSDEGRPHSDKKALASLRKNRGSHIVKNAAMPVRHLATKSRPCISKKINLGVDFSHFAG